MKTAISIPDPVFHAAEKAAKELAMSRSELYTKAVESFLKTQSDADVTQRLNDVYATQSSSVDPALLSAAIRSVGAESW